MLRDEILQSYAGHPRESEGALDEFDESLNAAGSLSLADPAREAAWAAFG